MEQKLLKVFFPKFYRANKKIPQLLDCVLEWQKRADSIGGVEGYELKICTKDLITRLLSIYD